MSAAKCVHKKYTRYGWQQCSRTAKVDGYCAQHHPDAVKARRTASDAKYRSQLAADMKRAADRDALERRGKDALDALEVPGVADVLLAVASMHETPGNQDQRAALATLAKIASEGK